MATFRRGRAIVHYRLVRPRFGIGAPAALHVGVHEVSGVDTDVATFGSGKGQGSLIVGAAGSETRAGGSYGEAIIVERRKAENEERVALDDEPGRVEGGMGSIVDGDYIDGGVADAVPDDNGAIGLEVDEGCAIDSTGRDEHLVEEKGGGSRTCLATHSNDGRLCT